MAGISLSGIGSGLDLNGLVTQLITAEAETPNRRLDTREAGFQARISAYGTLKSALSEFRVALDATRTATSFQARSAAATDAAVLTASVTNDAEEASYSIEVSALARAHKLASKSFADKDTVVGEGTLSFRFGSYDAGGNTFTPDTAKTVETVVIDTSASSVQGIRDAVNAAAIGVTASVINDGTGERLVFSAGETGAARSLEITVTGDSVGGNADDDGLSQLAFDPTAAGPATGKNLTETVTALDASFSIDGLPITRSSNTVTGAIEGVTISLKDVTSGTPVTLDVTRDDSATGAAVDRFVNAFNSLVGTFESLASFDAETGGAGILLGDSLLRGVESRVRRVATDLIEGLGGTAFRSLGDIGISTTESGTLALDSSALEDAIRDNPDAVASLFAVAGSISDPAIAFEGSSAQSTVGEYAINVTQVATRGSYTGATASAFVVNADNDTFSISVDGASSETITLTQASYASGAALATELQARINADSELGAAGVSVSVAFDSDRFVITSSRFGSASKVDIVSTDLSTAATLGLGAGGAVAADGVDVAGTIGGSLASGSGQVLTGAGIASGIALKIEGGALGSRGTVTFSRGVAEQLHALVGSYLEGDNALDASIEGLETRIASIAEQREILGRRLGARELRLRRQFAALDGLIAQLQTTSTFLAQQLGSSPRTGSSNANS